MSQTTTVTNNTVLPSPAQDPQAGWDGSLVAIQAYGPKADEATLGYGQTLAQLAFSNGGTLAQGQSDTLTLAAPLDGLVFAQADNLFPVQGYLGADVIDSAAALTVPTPAVAAGSNSPTVNAWLLIQAICANASGPLMKQFAGLATRLSQTDLSASDAETAVEGFFQSHPPYQNVTAEALAWVASYLASFANAWADFSDSYSYDLCTAAADGGDAVPVGKVVFARLAQAGGCVPVTDAQGNTNANGGYAISYHSGDDDTAGTPLYFSRGSLLSSLTDANPIISLQCAYYSLATITGVRTDTAVPILFGRVQGQNALGLNIQQAVSLAGKQTVTLAETPDGSADSESTGDKIKQWYNTALGGNMGWTIALTAIAGTVGLVGVVWLFYKLVRAGQAFLRRRERAQKLQEMLDQYFPDIDESDIESEIKEDIGQTQDMPFEKLPYPQNQPQVLDIIIEDIDEDIISEYAGNLSVIANDGEAELNQAINREIDFEQSVIANQAQHGVNQQVEIEEKEVQELGQKASHYTDSNPKDMMKEMKQEQKGVKSVAKQEAKSSDGQVQQISSQEQNAIEANNNKMEAIDEKEKADEEKAKQEAEDEKQEIEERE